MICECPQIILGILRTRNRPALTTFPGVRTGPPLRMWMTRAGDQKHELEVVLLMPE